MVELRIRALILRRQYESQQIKERWNDPPRDFAADVISLSGRQQQNLSATLRDYDLGAYDRIVIDLKWRFMRTQAATLARIPNLVMHEFDAFHNFMPAAEFFLDFERLWHSLGSFRLICCGTTVGDQLRAQGLDVRVVAKSYVPDRIQNLGHKRDIEVSFVGRDDGPLYRGRRRMLHQIGFRIALRRLRTATAEEYCRTLNRIVFFVSADVGMHEYTAKNFEAMAAGCVLVAYRQGTEEEALGLKDMENVVLYRTAEEAVIKITALLADPVGRDRIARNGRTLVRERYTAAHRDEQLWAALRPPLPAMACDRRSVARRVLSRVLPRVRIAASRWPRLLR